jgi:hypothetical protein
LDELDPADEDDEVGGGRNGILLFVAKKQKERILIYLFETIWIHRF